MDFSPDGLQNTPLETKMGVAKRLRERRKEYHWSMEELAKRSGVTYASLKRFEETGEISFSSLILLAWTLGYLEDFDGVLSKRHYGSMEELLDENHKAK